MPPLAKTIIFAVLTFALAGCGTSSVAIKRTVPAKFNIVGIKSVTITPFTYTMSYHKKGSTLIPEALEKALKKSGFFTLNALPAKYALKMDEEFSGPRIRSIGQTTGSDAVITGKVMAFQVTTDTEEIPVETEEPKDDKKEIGISIMGNAAEVSFFVDLYDVRNGKRLNHEYFSKIGNDIARGEDAKNLPADEKVLKGVADVLAEKFVRLLRPHEITEKITFKNDKPCKDGVKLAKSGNWIDATASWNGLISADPNCHCALYNLGLAREIKEAHEEALDLYLKAQNLSPQDELYRRAAARIKGKMKDEERLAKQMKGRKESIMTITKPNPLYMRK